MGFFFLRTVLACGSGNDLMKKSGKKQQQKKRPGCYARSPTIPAYCTGLEDDHKQKKFINQIQKMRVNMEYPILNLHVK